MNRTTQAIRQIIYEALTSPQLQYQINAGSAQTLPVANIIPHAVWLPGGSQAPMPAVFFDVQPMGFKTRKLFERNLRLMVWCVSSSGPDECTEISEAVMSLLHTADQDTEGPTDISRPTTTSALGSAVRKCECTRGSLTDYESETSRWYRTLEFSIVAH